MMTHREVLIKKAGKLFEEAESILKEAGFLAFEDPNREITHTAGGIKLTKKEQELEEWVWRYRIFARKTGQRIVDYVEGKIEFKDLKMPEFFERNAVELKLFRGKSKLKPVCRGRYDK